ncbi:DUF3768 domain-containing protein [Pseudorhizobium flavum]|uniref:DUF3768 domain-containing protein n=1 Tax=Pseudorhizobium flavum TaxID=1335061 RepID=UPI00376F7273
MSSTNPEAVAKIRMLNFVLRQTGVGGTIAFMGGLAHASQNTKQAVFAAVQNAEVKHDGNDPHGEGDFGSVMVEGQKYLWKIDYYDKNMEYGSDDPSDPKVTQRVLSIFRAEDY